jgi:hypothetical protein
VDDGHGRIAGSFAVAGARRAAYAVVVASEVRAAGGHGELVVRPSGARSRLLPENGRHEMSLDFLADENPAPGRYAGTFAVTVAYN